MIFWGLAWQNRCLSESRSLNKKKKRQSAIPGAVKIEKQNTDQESEH